MQCYTRPFLGGLVGGVNEAAQWEVLSTPQSSSTHVGCPTSRNHCATGVCLSADVNRSLHPRPSSRAWPPHTYCHHEKPPSLKQQPGRHQADQAAHARCHLRLWEGSGWAYLHLSAHGPCLRAGTPGASLSVQCPGLWHSAYLNGLLFILFSHYTPRACEKLEGRDLMATHYQGSEHGNHDF
jgi:hypothetical protein